MTDEEQAAIEAFMERSRRKRVKRLLEEKLATARRRKYGAVLIPVEALERLVKW